MEIVSYKKQKTQYYIYQKINPCRRTLLNSMVGKQPITQTMKESRVIPPQGSSKKSRCFRISEKQIHHADRRQDGHISEKRQKGKRNRLGHIDK